jgi:ABC-2 type transport system permease protein
MSKRFLGDTAVLMGRSLRHITRSPDTIVTTVITPIAIMLLFVFVFGGAITTGSDSYVSYLLPGSLLITIASGVSYTALRLFTDLQSGIFERFQSLPIARSSVLWAHVGTSLAPPWSRSWSWSVSPWSWASAPGPGCWPGSRSPPSWSCSPWP